MNMSSQTFLGNIIPSNVSEEANVHDSCIIGVGTAVSAGADIALETVIGEQTTVCQNVLIGSKCSIGNNCRIGQNVSLGSLCKIGNNVAIPAGLVLQDNDVMLCSPLLLTHLLDEMVTITDTHIYFDKEERFTFEEWQKLRGKPKNDLLQNRGGLALRTVKKVIQNTIELQQQNVRLALYKKR
jgi:carbonic anhydrase/acetyltransferase-like protein (isoleucine patch superfamily)